MTLDLLKSAYDQSIDNSATSPYAINPSGFTASSTDYCATATVGGWTAFKHGPAGVIGVTKASAFTASSCS
jgi:hypothetical protein